MSSEDSPSFSPPHTASLAPPSEIDSTNPSHLSWPAIWVVLVCLAAVLAAVGQICGGPGTRGMMIFSITLVTCMMAAWHDAATSRIPNQLTYTAILIGLTVNSLSPLLAMLHLDLAVRWLGAVGPGPSFAGFGICAGVGLLGISLAGMGGGDAKLLGAIGALLGWPGMASVLVFALAVAVIYSLINLLIAGRLNVAVRTAALWLIDRAIFGKAPEITPIQRATIPLAIPLFLGLIISQTSGGAWLLRSLGI